MADTKISALISVGSVDAADEFAVNNAGTSQKANASQILDYVVANLTLAAQMDVNGNEIVSLSGGDIVLHSDNDVNVILGDAAGADDFNIKDSASSIVFSVNSDGAISATSYGGISEANLLDKSASETVSGNYTFSNDVNFPGHVQTFTAGEALNAGEAVYINPANSKVLKADATTNIKVIGIAQDSVALDASVNVLMAGNSTTHAGLTVGTIYYLSTTAGGLTATAPSGAGETIIRLGTAIGTTSLVFEPQIIGVLG